MSINIKSNYQTQPTNPKTSDLLKKNDSELAEYLNSKVE